MELPESTLDLLRNLARKPGHDEVKAYFLELLVQEFGAERSSLQFEKRQPEICGRLDALIGRTVFEAKRDLDREISDVERRMPDYLADCEREHGEPFVGIASDGFRWIVYELANGQLSKIKETTLDPDKGEQFLAWLDGILAIKGSLHPDALTIRAELGPDSVAFKRVDRELRALWSEVEAIPAEALKRQLWADMLKLVYGREVDDPTLWFRHSYLVIVTKCIALAVLDLREDDPARMLSGRAFEAAGITGAVESDFFDWMVATPAGCELVGKIMAHVRRFRLREVESDVLKILYEALIDASERHELGEYYTPDWLAAKVVRHAVTAPLEQRVLDPACGSGTFLFHAVRRFLAEAEDAGIDLGIRAAEACKVVAGVDIHPVAVIIARVTFLLALAPALGNRKGGFSVPVYLGDAMQLGIAQTITDKRLEIRVPPPPAGAEPLGERPGVEILSFPETLCRDPGLFDKVVERMRTASLQGTSREAFESSLTPIVDKHLLERPMTQTERASGKRPEGMSEEHALAIKDVGATYQLFDRLRREGRDTIWSYVARNLSRPLSLTTDNGWAHVIVGNPPWVAYRNMSDDLQKRFKELATELNVYVGHIPSHNDLCALFTVRASHLYLRPSGRLAVVLPYSALTRAQFEKFRAGNYRQGEPVNIAWDEAWTMDNNVKPLFPVPACALFGRKRAIGKATPTIVRVYSGTLPMRDAPEEMADRHLRVTENAPAPSTAVRSGGSDYRTSFRQGAILVPRAFVLVERKSSGRLGSNEDAPLVVSRRSSQEKKPWKDVPGLEGNVEKEYLRPVLLGESILPYRTMHEFEGVIPITEKGEMLSSISAANIGSNHLSNWMTEAEGLWESNGKGKRSFVEQLNYINQLTSQFPIAPVRIVYAASGTLPAAMVVRDNRVVVEHALYWTKANSSEEALFLVAIINSETLRTAAEKYQAIGQFGARHFDKVIWNLPIPVYDPEDSLHRDLANAGARAEAVAAGIELVETEKFQRARKRIRDGLIENGIAAEIETLVENLLASD